MASDKISRDQSHGTISSYEHGCRCSVCRAANTHRHQKGREKRRARTKANGGIAPVSSHGSATARNWGCRCTVCLAAVAEYNSRLRVRPEFIEQVRTRSHRLQRESLPSANRYRFEWTGPEIELAARRDLTAQEIAAATSRTVAAVRNMRQRIKAEDPKVLFLLGKEKDRG